MGNTLFDRFGGNAGIPQRNNNPMLNAINMVQLFRQIQNDPSKIADLLLNNGKITQDQYNEIQKFNGNPELIGRYLMQSGTMTQQDINNIQRTI